MGEWWKKPPSSDTSLDFGPLNLIVGLVATGGLTGVEDGEEKWELE